jgi:hypothetical protein
MLYVFSIASGTGACSLSLLKIVAMFSLMVGLRQLPVLAPCPAAETTTKCVVAPGPLTCTTTAAAALRRLLHHRAGDGFL